MLSRFSCIRNAARRAVPQRSSLSLSLSSSSRQTFRRFAVLGFGVAASALLLSDSSLVHASSKEVDDLRRMNTELGRELDMSNESFDRWTNYEGERLFVAHIPSITCNSCVNKITKRLAEEEGVAHAVVSLAAKAVVVVRNKDVRFEPMDLVRILKDIGHTVRPALAPQVANVIMAVELKTPKELNSLDYEVFGRTMRESEIMDAMLRVSPCSKQCWAFHMCALKPGLLVRGREKNFTEAEQREIVENVSRVCMPLFETAVKCAQEHDVSEITD